MSLDHTLEALVQFSQQLQSFDATLRASHRELRELHAAVDALWQDEARRTYDRAMGELEARLAQYLGPECAGYEEFIRQKLRELHAYLHGA